MNELIDESFKQLLSEDRFNLFCNAIKFDVICKERKIFEKEFSELIKSYFSESEIILFKDKIFLEVLKNKKLYVFKDEIYDIELINNILKLENIIPKELIDICKAKIMEEQL